MNFRHLKQYCAISLFLTFSAFSEPLDSILVTMPTVVVTANRVPVGALQVNRLIQAIDSSLFRSVNGHSLEDILRAFTTLDLQPRGPFGVQTDIGMRGSLFSQNLVLLNGIRMNDPQSAHHNFDLPLPLSQIERVEIMKGPGSAQYGPDAFGGVINILLKRPSGESGSIKVSGGEHGFLSVAGTHDVPLNGWRVSNSAEYRRSSGFRYDTDFEIWSVSSNHGIDFMETAHSLFVGYTGKRFGAFDFYSPGRNVPSKEWTSTAFASLDSQYLLSSLLVSPTIFFRRHDDKFMFDIRTPNQFVNTHRTYTYGGKLLGTLRMNHGGVVTGGIEFENDRIKSSRLGEHSRSLTSLFVNNAITLAGGLNIDGGIRYDVSSMYGSHFNPIVGVGFTLSDRGKLFANVGRSFRAPTYTELYYSDPANEGNPNLRPENGWSYEFGTQYRLSDGFVGSASVYIRDQKNLIDYVQLEPAGKFHAVNFTIATTNGAEASVEWSCGNNKDDQVQLQRILIQYSLVESTIDRRGAISSKYSFTNTKHQVTANISGVMLLEIRSNVSAVFKYKSKSNNYLLLNLGFTRQFGSLSAFLNISNLLNTHYEEVVGVPQPGRWVIGGLEWALL